MSIAANELRIGNWVRFINKTFQVGPETIEDCYKANITQSPYQYEPIPLSPSVLEACGFRYYDNDWYEKGEINVNITDGRICITQKWQVFVNANINHLHQLQNLHFALTGQELIYNPPTK